MGLSDTLPWTIMEAIPGITDRNLLITNGEGEDDDDEWHLPDFGRDDDYARAFDIYRYFTQYGILPYSGGWADQLAIHKEIIDIFSALDVAIKRPENER